MSGSTGERWLEGEGVRHIGCDTARAAVEALAVGELDAVVHDAPILRHHAKGEDDLTVLPGTLDRQDYAFAFPGGSALPEPVNRELLALLASEEWERLRFRYLGER